MSRGTIELPSYLSIGLVLDLKAGTTAVPAAPAPPDQQARKEATTTAPAAPGREAGTDNITEACHCCNSHPSHPNNLYIFQTNADEISLLSELQIR